MPSGTYKLSKVAYTIMQIALSGVRALVTDIQAV